MGDAVTSLGSTLVIKLLSNVRINDVSHGVYSHRVGARWLVGGASNTGGAVLLVHFSVSDLARLSALIEPQTESGLDYYPLVRAGERFPVNDPAHLPRLTLRPPDDVMFLHGLFEGMARIEAQGYDLLARLDAPTPRRILTVGGGAANAAWQSIRQRMLAAPVTAAEESEASIGMARLAARALR